MLFAAGTNAQAATLARWVQYDAAGIAEARAVTDQASCPTLNIDDQPVAMQERAAPDGDFPLVCWAALPVGAKRASIEGKSLPLPSPSPRRILVTGDTGCRIAEGWYQDCNDSERWPFAHNAASAAEIKPDLIIHVGDYLYREAACPPIVPGCAGSPHGDNWQSWNADLFAPGAPLFAAAPWIAVRGNHEICARAGRGWTRLLGPRPYDPANPCADHEPPYVVKSAGLGMIVLDDANASDNQALPQMVSLYRADLADVQGLATGPSWLLMHRPIWAVVAVRGSTVIGGNWTLAIAAKTNPLPAEIGLMLAGHIHTAQVLNYAGGLPPQILAGNGGDALDMRTPQDLAGLEVAGATIADGFSSGGFGFLTLEREVVGWRAGFFDVTGHLKRSCAVRDRRVDCPPI